MADTGCTIYGICHCFFHYDMAFVPFRGYICFCAKYVYKFVPKSKRDENNKQHRTRADVQIECNATHSRTDTYEKSCGDFL